MQTTLTSRVLGLRTAALVLVAAGAAGCSVESQKAPEVAGPSELAQAIAVTAVPDRLPQDGSSQSLVTAVARDDQGRPITGLGLRWTVTVSDGTALSPSESITQTDSQGRSSTRITAPPPPQQLPTTPVTLRVEVEPIGPDSQAVFGEPTIPRRSVIVELVPPQSTQPANRLPVAAFTVVPSIANVNQAVTVNASTTTDEGVACGSLCSYLWNFGDSTSDTGMVVDHTYSLPATYTITLTVVDARGGVNSTTRSLVVSGPAGPTANFTSSPPTPLAGAVVTFNASGTTVGAGAVIEHYDWDFGDGTTLSGTTALAQHAYGSAGTYLVTLTVTDNLGRKSTRLGTVTVT